jgi:hypothetical protein
MKFVACSLLFCVFLCINSKTAAIIFLPFLPRCLFLAAFELHFRSFLSCVLINFGYKSHSIILVSLFYKETGHKPRKTEKTNRCIMAL